MTLIHRAISTRKARRDVQTALSDAFGADAPSSLRLIKDSPLARVAEGRWQGRQIIVKQFHSPEPASLIAAMLAEHKRLGALFPHDGLKVAALRAHAPAQGLVILDKAPGIPLDLALDPCTATERARLVGHAGAWLARSLGDSRAAGSFRPRFWLDRLDRDSADLPLTPDDRALFGRTMDQLHALGTQLKRGAIPKGAVHGDFGPYNLHWDARDQSLWAFDIQRTSDLPLALDMARFLVALSEQAQRQHPDCALCQGILPADLAALLAVPGLNHAPDELPFLDFFLGYRLLRSLREKHGHPHAPMFRRSLTNWLETQP